MGWHFVMHLLCKFTSAGSVGLACVVWFCQRSTVSQQQNMPRDIPHDLSFKSHGSGSSHTGKTMRCSRNSFPAPLFGYVMYMMLQSRALVRPDRVFACLELSWFISLPKLVLLQINASEPDATFLGQLSRDLQLFLIIMIMWPNCRLCGSSSGIMVGLD